MLAVQPQQFELPRDQISMDSAPTIHFQETGIPHASQKQQIKKSLFSPYKILLGLAVFFMLIMVSYKVYNEYIVTPTESEINSAHGKIIQNADSSSKDKASNSGSSSSKSSKNNEKPNPSSQPASKLPISSNNNNGFGSSSNGGNDEDDNNDGDKNKKILDSGKSSSETKHSKYAVSTDEDSDSVDTEEDEQAELSEGLMWPVNKDDGPAPLIGSTRP